MSESAASLAAYIDHTLLKPQATQDDIRTLCAEARQHGFCAVCVTSSHVPLVRELLMGSGVSICSVIGFPLGTASTRAKVMETRQAVADGANEIDMVMHVGALKDGRDGYVMEDILQVKAACGPALLKVIIETGLLSDQEKIRACVLSRQAGADFVKTSTGFGPGGATVEDIRLMKQTVGEALRVKASGGVRTTQDALNMIAAGADRLGTSSGVAIVTGTGAGGVY